MPSSDAALGPETRVARTAVLLTLPFLLGLGPVIDPDLGWHLRTGAWIVEHRALPRVDPFMRLAEGHPWMEYAWLFDLMVGAAAAGLGLVGVMLLRATALAMLAWILDRALRQLGMSPWPALAAALTGVLAAGDSLTERPWLATAILLPLVIEAALSLLSGRRRQAWFLVPLFALWANLHIQFVYGLGVLGLAALDGVLNDGLRPSRWRPTTRELARLIAACAAATLINPYGPKLWQTVFDYAQDTAAFGLIIELLPPTFHRPWELLTLGLIAATFYTLGRRWLSLARRPWFALLLMIFATFFFLHARRDAFFAAFSSLLILASLGVGASVVRVPRFAAVALALLLIVDVGLGLHRQTNDVLEAALAEQYPVAAVAEVERLELEGPLYNDLGWGGFLMWRLPRLMPWIDGRNNLLTNDQLRTNAYSWRLLATDPALDQSRLVIANRGFPLSQKLADDPAWETVFADEHSLVLVRRR